MTVKTQTGSSIVQLAEIMERLLAPDGCPWDQRQTFAMLKRFAVEETYEVLDAIDDLGRDAHRSVGMPPERTAQDPAVKELRSELGDLLLQVVFQSELARRWSWFTLDDVVAGISSKMIRRHPHVFGTESVDPDEPVNRNWEKLKALEHKDRRTLDGLPKGLPALTTAQRLGEKAGAVGFDWPDATGPRAKIDEELSELDEALASGNREDVVHELGDVLFSVVNVARKAGVDPEEALRACNARFRKRFEAVEAAVIAEGGTMRETSADALNVRWEQVKREER